MATQCSLSSLELRVQFCLLVCCTYPSWSTVNKEKNLKVQRASLRVDTRETQQYGSVKTTTMKKKDKKKKMTMIIMMAMAMMMMNI